MSFSSLLTSRAPILFFGGNFLEEAKVFCLTN